MPNKYFLYSYFYYIINPMIKLPKPSKTQLEHSHPSYFGILPFSFAKNSFLFPPSINKHAFYPSRTIPPPQRHSIKFTEVSKDIFVIGKTAKIFRVIGKEAHKFQFDDPIHRVRILGNQAFYASSNRLYSTVENHFQSLDIENIDMDVTEVSKEVMLLQKNMIQIVNGPKYPIDGDNFRFIHFGDHPRTAYTFTDQGVYLVDLRAKKSTEIIGLQSNIKEITANETKLIFRTNIGITIIDKRMENQIFGSLLTNLTMNVRCNDDYIVTWKNTHFCYYQIENLNIYETKKYDLHDLVSFATFKDKYFFIRRKKIDEFTIDGPVCSYFCPIVETWFKHAEVEFFDKELVEGKKCDDYFEIDDINSVKFDNLLESIDKFGVEQEKPKDETIKMKKVKRVGGF